MNTFTSNPTAAALVAHRVIQDRVEDAERRTQVRAVRAAQKAAREAARRSGTPVAHPLPWAAFRFLHPVR